MSVPELKRCFQCGATHPQSVILCPRDGTPLCFDVVGRHWKIEGLVGRRPGGASFTAVHVSSGQRGLIELIVPGESASDSPALIRFQQQLQALRMLDLNKGILKLIEEGTEERDGARFLVTDLGMLRQLGDVLAERRPEWQRPGGAQMEPTEAAHLVRPLLSVLSTAGRLGMAHGSLDMSQIYIGSETHFQSGLGMLSHVKLHGIVAVGMGPQLRDAQAADLRIIARILYELCTGKPLPEGEEVPKEPLPESLSGPVGQVVLRAIGVTGPALFASAEEMQRALSTAAPSGFTAPISVPPGLQPASAPIPPPRPRIEPALARTLPPPPSAPSLPNLGAASVATTLPPVRVTSSQPSVPTPLQPVAGLPQRSGLTSELRQVSILDLMREMQQQKDAAARQETLARSRFRPSSQEIKVLPLPPPGGESGEPAAAAALAPDANEGPTVVDRPRSGQSLEPTLDGQELPLRPESASSARGPASGLDAADLGTAPSSASAGAPAPSASSARAAAPASARSAASGRLAASGLGAAPSEAPPPSAASSPRPSAASGSRLPLPSAASSPPPLPPSAASSPRPSASAQSARAASATSSASPPRGGGVSELEDAPTEPFAPAVSAAAISAIAASAAAASAAAALAASASARAAAAAAAPAAAAPAAAAPALAVPVAAPPEMPPAPVAASGLAPVPRWAWFAIIAPLIAIILGLVAKILFSK